MNPRKWGQASKWAGAICWQDERHQEGNAPCPDQPPHQGPQGLYGCSQAALGLSLSEATTPRLAGNVAWFPKIHLLFPQVPPQPWRRVFWSSWGKGECVCPRP